MPDDSKTTSDVIVIGGGVAGLSTALQLARRGKQVRVLERERLGNGSTGRAAGLLGQLRGSAEHTRMLMESVRIVKQLEAEAGMKIYVQTGSVRLGATEARAQEVRDAITVGQQVGLEIESMDIAEVARRMPYMRTDDLLHVAFCPTDGHLKPIELAETYHQLGLQAGVTYHESCPVNKIIVENDKAVGVETKSGRFEADCIVNAGGPWSYLIAELAEQTLPTAAIKHHYFITDPQPDTPIDEYSPAVRDRHIGIYSRPELGGLLVGTYGEAPVSIESRNLPVDFDMSKMEHQSEHYNLERALDQAQRRFPWLQQTTPLKLTTGIMTFTPDGRPFCGKLPHVEGLYHCAGFNGHGIVQSPAIGLIMAEMIVDGRSQFDIEAVETDRLDRNNLSYTGRDQIDEACREMYRNYYGRVETPLAS